MKLAMFCIISVGLIFTFLLAGVDTGTASIVGFSMEKNASDVNVNPDLPVEGIIDFLSPTAIFTYLIGMGIWALITVSLFALAIIYAVGKVSIIGFAPNISGELGFAAIGIAIWALIAVDMWSVVQFVGNETANAGWVYYSIWIFITCYLIAFGFAIFSFIRSGQ